MNISGSSQMDPTRSSAISPSLERILNVNHLGNRIAPSQSCALRELEAIRPSSNRGVSSPKSDDQKFIDWVVYCRNVDDSLEDEVKGSCPFTKCPFVCSVNNNLEFLQHMSNCPHIKEGLYNCPRHDNTTEVFMITQPKKRWFRLQELIDACCNACCGLNKSLSQSHRMVRRSKTSYSSRTVTNSDSASSTGSQLPIEQRGRSTSLSSENFSGNVEDFSGKNNNLFHSQSLDGLQSEVSPIKRPDYHTQGCVEKEVGQNPFLASELSPDPEYGNIPIICREPTCITSEMFENPIPIPTDVKTLDSLRNCQLGVEAMFTWPMNQNQVLPMNHPISVSQTAVSRFRSKSPANFPPINTNVGESRRVSESPRSSPTSLSERHPSTRDDPEILRYAPLRLLQELQSVIYNVTVSTLAVLAALDRLVMSHNIIARCPSAAEVFLSGLDAVESILQGNIPNDAWCLFAFAQLSIACGAVIWENNVGHQSQQLYDDLKVWAGTLQSAQERRDYLQIIAWRFGRNIKQSEFMHGQDEPYREESKLRAKLRDGVAIRLCVQFLTTFEFLQNKYHHSIYHQGYDFRSDFKVPDFSSKHTAAIRTTVIGQLLAMEQFTTLRQAVTRVSDLLKTNPHTAIRDVELALICCARYHTRDHNLHLRFRETVAELCRSVSIELEYPLVEVEKHLIEDISRVRQMYQESKIPIVAGELQSTASNPILSQAHKYNIRHGPQLTAIQNSIDIPDLLHSSLLQGFQSGPILPDQNCTTRHMFDSFQTVYGSSEPNSNNIVADSSAHSMGSYHNSGMMNPPDSATTRTPSSVQSYGAHGSLPSWTQTTPSTAASFHRPADWSLLATDHTTNYSSKVFMQMEPNVFEAMEQVDQSFQSGSATVPGVDYYENFEQNIRILDQEPVDSENPLGLDANIDINMLKSGVNKPLPPNPPQSASSDSQPSQQSPRSHRRPRRRVAAKASTESLVSCPICKQQFTGQERYQRANCARHQKEKHNSTPELWRCKTCEIDFTRKANMKNHMTKQHPQTSE